MEQMDLVKEKKQDAPTFEECIQNLAKDLAIPEDVAEHILRYGCVPSGTI